MRKTDLKKHIILLLFTVSIILLCSCSSNEGDDTHFIHAMGFQKEGQEYIIFSVCEKFEKDKSDYFLIEQRGKSIEEALDKIQKEYEGCYFATIKYYFIPSEFDESFIANIAKEICDSNILPSKNSICLVSNTSVKDFMGQIKSSNDTKKIKKELHGKSTNTIKFFSQYTSDKVFKATFLSSHDNGTTTAKEKVILSDNKGE